MAAVAPTGDPLVGRVIRLDRMAAGDLEGLHVILADPATYADGYLMSTPSSDLADSARFLEDRRSRGGGHVAYTARLVADGPLGAAGTVVGTSSIGDVEVDHERAHIGWTMWGRRWWGTAVNPEAKLLMLGHCFDDCGFGRVKLQTDARNVHSQAAIAKLGARREGVLRRHARRADGSFRDTVVFSILREEWPDVRATLEARLGSTS